MHFSRVVIIIKHTRADKLKHGKDIKLITWDLYIYTIIS